VGDSRLPLPVFAFAPSHNGGVNARRPTTPRPSGGATRASAPAKGARPASPTPITPRKKSASGPRAANAGPGRNATTRGRAGSRVEFNTRNNGTVSISWRAIVLTLVCAVAFVLVTPTLRLYLRQQEQERTLNNEVSAIEARNDELQRGIDRWSDPDYVRSKARERLGFVMPGQQPYIVVDPEAVVGEEAQQAYEEQMGYTEVVGPWYFEVWDSIRLAGDTEGAAGG